MMTMMKLLDILNGIDFECTEDLRNLQIAKIQFDSRKIGKGDLFVAIEGVHVDGHEYVDKAIQSGARAVVVSKMTASSSAPVIKVENTSIALGFMARNMHNDPSADMQVVGVTGTNGKTSVTTLLYKLFRQLGYKVGLISTVENRIDGEVINSTHTTPDVLSINQLLKLMRDRGCAYVFMEVSSHAIDQRRIAGLKFAGGVFTNITHDHLDYHKTFKAYIDAKKAFFDDLPTSAFALTNVDDKRGEYMLQNTKAIRKSFALKRAADFKCKVTEHHPSGLILDMGGHEVFTRLVGDFNAYNLLSVYAVSQLLHADQIEVLSVLSTLQTAKGRFDFWQDQKTKIKSIVDYAHTPDALENVLMTIERMRSKSEQLITIIGCGGDRDRAKRPLMTRVACAYSQQVILTSDNPRSEEPNDILKEMQEGIPIDAVAKVLIIEDRRQAIRTATRLAKPQDIILLAGKGHESYQEIKGVRYPFDDKVELENAINEL